MGTKIKITEEQLKRLIKSKNLGEQIAPMGFAKEANEEDNESSIDESIEKIADLFCELFPDNCKDGDYIEGIFSLAKSAILNGKDDSEEDEEGKEDDDKKEDGNVMFGGEDEKEDEEGKEDEDEEEEDNNMMNESIKKIKSNFRRFL